MRHFDLTPLYRSTVGFDQLFSMLDAKGTEQQGSAYLPITLSAQVRAPIASPWQSPVLRRMS